MGWGRFVLWWVEAPILTIYFFIDSLILDNLNLFLEPHRVLMLVMVFVVVRSAMVFFVGDLVIQGLLHVWLLGNLGEHSRNPFHSVKMRMVIVGSGGVPTMLVLASVDVTVSSIWLPFQAVRWLYSWWHVYWIVESCGSFVEI
jgi:hypothetical protein